MRVWVMTRYEPANGKDQNIRDRIKDWQICGVFMSRTEALEELVAVKPEIEVMAMRFNRYDTYEEDGRSPRNYIVAQLLDHRDNSVRGYQVVPEKGAIVLDVRIKDYELEGSHLVALAEQAEDESD